MDMEYTQGYSFRAELYWRDTRMFKHRIGASLDDSTIFKTNDGWLFAGIDNYTRFNGVVRVREVIKMDFWLGCYVRAGQCFFDIRCISLTRDEPFFAARLEPSRNGFLGWYIPEDDRRQPSEAQLWQLEGFDPAHLAVGYWLNGMTLRSPRGHAVKRLYQQGFPYLSESSSGEHGILMIKVVQVGQGYPFP